MSFRDYGKRMRQRHGATRVMHAHTAEREGDVGWGLDEVSDGREAMATIPEMCKATCGFIAGRRKMFSLALQAGPGLQVLELQQVSNVHRWPKASNGPDRAAFGKIR